uniref:DUF19 domain-containing protein n=1 Tax=Caenorhabditis tropicalis TaxID=1561998 RepID=A0A1I7TUV5_9PELO
MNVCAWIGTFLCCVLCSGMVCFVIFGGTLYVTFLALFTAINECEGRDLIAAQKCAPLIASLVNETIEPTFEESENLQKLVDLCGNATFCMSDVKCFSYKLDFLKSAKGCDLYSFIQEDFGTCAAKLKQKSHMDCVKFLFQTEKCDGWVENQKCVEKEIEKECGPEMLKKYGKISKSFLFAACKKSTPRL